MGAANDTIQPDAWEIDLRQKMAKHTGGLVVYFTNDPLYPGRWIARKSNAVAWAQENFSERAPRISAMLRSASAAYDHVFRNRYLRNK